MTASGRLQPFAGGSFRPIAVTCAETKGSTLVFKRPKRFDLKQYDDEGRFGFGEGKRVNLTFRIEKDYGYFLLETKLSPDQVIRDLGAAYEVSATVVDSSMLEWWLRSFGDNVSNVRRAHVSGRGALPAT